MGIVKAQDLHVEDIVILERFPPLPGSGENPIIDLRRT